MTDQDRGTVWLTQLEMAKLFNASQQNISLHLKNLFQDGELHEESVVKESLTAQTGGGLRLPIIFVASRN